MKKVTKSVGVVLAAGLALLCVAGCRKNTEATAEQPKGEHPAATAPKAEHPKGEHPAATAPKAEQPEGERPATNAPTADNPKG